MSFFFLKEKNLFLQQQKFEIEGAGAAQLVIYIYICRLKSLQVFAWPFQRSFYLHLSSNIF